MRVTGNIGRGLSPLARGKQVLVQGIPDLVGPIPAGAGETTQ